MFMFFIVSVPDQMGKYYQTLFWAESWRPRSNPLSRNLYFLCSEKKRDTENCVTISSRLRILYFWRVNPIVSKRESEADFLERTCGTQIKFSIFCTRKKTPREKWFAHYICFGFGFGLELSPLHFKLLDLLIAFKFNELNQFN